VSEGSSNSLTCLGQCGGLARRNSNYCQQCWDRDRLLAAAMYPRSDYGRVFMTMVPLAIGGILLVLALILVVCPCAYGARGC
jgi:hypothetical protein